MKKLSTSIILKMTLVVVLNLAAFMWVFSPLAKPARGYVVYAGQYLSRKSSETWRRMSGMWKEIPSLGEMKDQFMEILQKPIEWIN
jgi:hypothetical protein